MGRRGEQVFKIFESGGVDDVGEKNVPVEKEEYCEDDGLPRDYGAVKPPIGYTGVAKPGCPK
ncbi:hypothetical protein E1B28_003574 [Marasmius oreades]|uniref:Uncharacterized protein n=1 Tax=Marasmius oreades TaxID=181124 RepID=A0A9P7RNB2_9AGAR|nr:uncharacterized protein E1B28_003574 [Marasmius oreades]KAG7086053.1 hypothetical protein E1B28_003574 [Marasmius oreades]